MIPSIWSTNLTFLKYSVVKKLLQEEYGWPYEFRETEWKANSNKIWKQLLNKDKEHEEDEEDEKDEVEYDTEDEDEY